MSKKTTPLELFAAAAAEVDNDEIGALSTVDRRLHSVAQKLLLLERDLKAPGAARTIDDRVERLLDTIAKETF